VEHQLSGAVLGRDFTVDEWGSFAQVATGDACPRCGTPVDLVRSVEAAHTFQLGEKYSSVMPGASFVAEDGEEAVFSMGCYGMGVSRLLSVLAEEHQDDRGLVWPDELEIECPQHGAMFSLVTGEPQTLPATQPVPVFVVERDGDDLYVTTGGGDV